MYNPNISNRHCRLLVGLQKLIVVLLLNLSNEICPPDMRKSSWYLCSKSGNESSDTRLFLSMCIPLGEPFELHKMWLIRSRATCAPIMNHAALVFLHIKKSGRCDRGHHQMELARHLPAIVERMSCSASHGGKTHQSLTNAAMQTQQ